MTTRKIDIKQVKPVKQEKRGKFLKTNKSTGIIDFVELEIDEVVWFPAYHDVTINKLVYWDYDDKLLKRADNTDDSKLPVRGIVRETKTENEIYYVRLQIKGERPQFDALWGAEGEQYYLGTNGNPTPQFPVTGNIIFVGKKVNNTILDINIENRIIKT